LTPASHGECVKGTRSLLSATEGGVCDIPRLGGLSIGSELIFASSCAIFL
jgi:hypothetical protein